LSGQRRQLERREEPPLMAHRFMLHHRHSPAECGVTFAAWRGFSSPLRGRAAICSCRFGSHELWWELDAASEADALSQLPPFVADRATAIRIEAVNIR
jgi:hypothetical protein